MKRLNLKKIMFYLSLSFLVVIFIFPIFYMVMATFKAQNEFYSYGFLPKSPSFDNYINILLNSNFNIYLKNTIITTVASTILTVIINTMCGYALAKFKFKGDKLFMLVITSTLMMPMILLVVPIFKIIDTLGLSNSLWALIIPPAATPTGIFIIRQYLLTIPDELIEAARIDGASEWSIFLKIVVPIAKPAIATLTIFSFMWRWNDYMWPLIAITEKKYYTLQFALGGFVGNEGLTDWAGLLTMSSLTMIPVLIVFLIFQRQFIQGTATSGMKG